MTNDPEYQDILFHKENHQTLLSDTDDILLSQGKNLVSVHSSGTPLFSTKFLDITEIVGILKSRTFVHTSIPDGLKNNVYFILDEKKNMEQKSYGKPPEFYDDCGAWDRKGKGAPTTYYHVKGEIISQITFNKSRNLYYTCKGLQIYPLSHPYEILIVKRYYPKLKADNNYGRWITRILEAPQSLISNIQYAVVEYKGLFPGHNSHGLSKTTDSIYLRTPSYVMDKIEELSKHNLPRTVYNATSSTKDETSINNMKQIRNK